MQTLKNLRGEKLAEPKKSTDNKKKEKSKEQKIGAELKNENKNKEAKISAMDKINNFLLRFSRIPLKEKLFFVQYLSIMVKSGISLSSALSTLAKQTKNKKFAKIINDISSNVEKGVSFTDSLRPYEDVFGELFINMVEAGEISGKLEEVLNQLYVQIKKQNELISKVKGALTYPAVIIFAMVGIGTFMMTVIVPKLTGMLENFGSELPIATKVLIAISKAITENGTIVLIGVILFILLAIRILKTYKGKYIFQFLVLKMPVAGPIVKKINIASFSRTVSSLLKTDIMIIKTFKITANVLGNLHYRKAVNEMSERIKKGSQINEIVTAYPNLFPPVVNQIISVGEETGELDNILAELADFYENEVDKIMDNLPAIIEPLLILILGCVVGGMAVAIVMPMYSLSSSI